ncbi:MAG TPA: glutathione transferase [Polyangia bacterium]|nr:glutathione transferase [Polyangia bacterium]
MSLVLHGSEMGNSPYVLSCFVALREKGLPFELRAVALQRGAQHQPAFVATSLTARVPVLEDGDLSLSESSAVVEYLEEAYPPPAYPRLLPSDLRARARARQVMAWVRSDVGALREERSSEYVFFPRERLEPPRPLSPDGQAAAEKVVRVASQLIPDGGGPLFGSWCIADTDLAMMLWRLWRTDFPLPNKLRLYAETEWARPSVRAFAEQPRPGAYATSV